MSIILRDSDAYANLTNLIDGLVKDADLSLLKLHYYQEIDQNHPSINDYEPLAGGYFALAVESHNLVTRLAQLEARTVPSTLLQRVPPEKRTTLIELARKHGHALTEETLSSIPFAPNDDRHPTTQ